MNLNMSRPIALLIDADNASPEDLGGVYAVLGGAGNICVQRAYGNWKKEGLARWQDSLTKHAITPVQVFDPAKGKNASDMQLVIEAMDLLHHRPIDLFAILSSDGDFMPLCLWLRQQSRKVLGFGSCKTSQTYRASCTHFYQLGAEEAGCGNALPVTMPSPGKKEPLVLEQTVLLALIQAVRAEIGNQWADMKKVAPIGVGTGIQPKLYQSANWTSLLKRLAEFEVSIPKGGGPARVRIRPGGAPAKDCLAVVHRIPVEDTDRGACQKAAGR